MDETEAESREIERETLRGSMREFHLDLKKPHANGTGEHTTTTTTAATIATQQRRESADSGDGDTREDKDAHDHDRRSARESVHEVVIQRAASPTRDGQPLDVKMAERKRQVTNQCVCNDSLFVFGFDC